MNLIKTNNYLLELLICALATLMWSISILGIWANLEIRSILIVMVINILFFAYTVNFIKKNSYLGLFKFDLVFFLALLQLSSTFYVTLIPPFTYDEVAYSASLPKDYASVKHFFYNYNYGHYSAFPQNYDAITTLSLIFSKSTSVVKILNIFLAIGITLASSTIAKLAGVKNKISIFAGLLVGCSSGFITALPIAKNDIANGFFQSWCIVALLIYLKKHNLLYVVLTALFLGTSVGIKYNSILFAAIIVPTFLLITVASKNEFRLKVKFILIFSFVLLITSIPWYLNNFLLFGNPIYPIANSFFSPNNGFTKNHIEMFKELFYTDLYNYSWLNGTLKGFGSRFVNDFGRFISIFAIFSSGYILLQRIFLKINKFSKIRSYIVSLTVLILLTILFFGFWEPRYSFVLLTLFGSLSAIFIQAIDEKINCKHKWLNLFLLILVLFGFYRGYKIYGQVELAYLKNTGKSFQEKYIPNWKLAEYLNNKTPLHSKIAVGIGTNQMFYYLERPYYYLGPLTGNLVNLEKEADLIVFLKENNINYIALSDWGLRPHAAHTPYLKRFYSIFYKLIDDAEKLNHIKKVEIVDDGVTPPVTIYKLISN
jgi:hypothetical protein